MSKLTLNDGTIIEGATVGATESGIWVYIRGDMELPRVFVLFYDPGRTATITCDYGSDVVERFDGYTELRIIDRRSDEIAVNLKRPDTERSA